MNRLNSRSFAVLLSLTLLSTSFPPKSLAFNSTNPTTTTLFGEQAVIPTLISSGYSHPFQPRGTLRFLRKAKNTIRSWFHGGPDSQYAYPAAAEVPWGALPLHVPTYAPPPIPQPIRTPNSFEIARQLPLRDQAGNLRELNDLMRIYIKRLIPEKKSKANDGEIVEALARFVNGLVVISTLLVLNAPRGLGAEQTSVLRTLIDQPRTLEEIAHEFNPGHEEATMGNLYDFLRVLALQHWIHMEGGHYGFFTSEGADQKTLFSLTERGREIVELIENEETWNALHAATDTLAHAEHYHARFRQTGPLDMTQRKGLDLLDRVIELAQRSENRWALPDTPGKALAVNELRVLLDGVLVAPVIAAFGQPKFGKGDVASVQDSSFIAKMQNGTLQLSDLKDRYNGEYLARAMRILATVRIPRTKRRNARPMGKFKDGVLKLNPWGKDLMRRDGSFGVPVSYVKSYQKWALASMLFNPKNLDPLDIQHHHHLDQIMNSWGAHSTHGSLLLPTILPAILPRVQGGLAGVSELGAGDGHLVATVAAACAGWRIVLDRYDAELDAEGKAPLDRRHVDTPFIAVAADYASHLMPRIRSTFQETFHDEPGIVGIEMVADVTQPAEFADQVGEQMWARVFMVGEGPNRRPLAVKDLLHMMMFVNEERSFLYPDMSKASAHDILRAAVTRLEIAIQAELEDNVRRLHDEVLLLLRAMGVLHRAVTELPMGEMLIYLISQSLDISMTDGGKLIPAEVAAVDLILYMERFAEMDPLGAIIADVCTSHAQDLDPRLKAATNINYYGTHLLREKIYTEHQRHLLYLLAGWDFRMLRNMPSKGPALVGLSELHRRSGTAPLVIPRHELAEAA